MNTKKNKLVREKVGGEWYEYVPLGKHIVAAPGVCGGRPTFKYTRLEVVVILDLLAAGHTIEELLREYSHSKLSAEAISEAILLARKAFVGSANKLRLAA
jgi:uncharacterized protein (DUF433 family)